MTVPPLPQAVIPASKIRLNSPVCRILWDEGDDKVLLVTQSGDSYLASHVIFTASFGHLKERHTNIFEPPLPESFSVHFGVRTPACQTLLAFTF